MKLERYDAVRRALSQATRVDEVKGIRDKAVAVQAYARQAKDGELIAKATDIRFRAETRAGELLIVMAKSGERPKSRKQESHRVTLGDLGISKMQSSRWQALARMPAERREAVIAKRIRVVVAAAENDVAVIRAARAERHEVKKARRQTRMRELVEKNAALPVERFGVIYADPEWQFEVYSEKGKDRAADNHYVTSALDVIKSRDVESIAADDSVLFLWSTVPMLPQALEVMTSWGFEYKSNFVWIKDRAGTGYWNRNRHELLLVGTRGDIPAPLEGTQWASTVEAKRGKHSEKPERFYDLIESYYPDLSKIELNARKPRDGWTAWGNEAEAADGIQR